MQNLKSNMLLLMIASIILCSPSYVFAAEVLQVRSPLIIQIGDQNRSYSVQLICLDIDSRKEKEAQEWLKTYLPRGKKVNLFPEGSKDGILLARVIPIGNQKNISQSLAEKGFGSYEC